ncbi:MAG: DUF262 domain-containing protein [Flammeovirgaceae bacterium]|jgi:uncharacterized protein with ParB-like and HNH nuclease domain|nr:DUF262 domain-containing protein [Flammeovirgaceae bacterium]
MKDEDKDFGRKSETELDVELIYSEEEDYNSSPSDYKITTYPADFTLEILAKKLEDKEIIVPNFQRQFVWKQAQATKLIESFLVGLPVPPIFLYKEIKSNKFLLIDGQQRLKSTKYFLDGYFGEEVKGKKVIFRLSSLNTDSKWYNKTYEELDERDQQDFKNRVLRAVIIQQLDPEDDSSIYHIFERLNTGGTFLNNQEIRNCIYYGAFNDLIRLNLNFDENYRKILGRAHPDQRMVDQELILRFFTMLDVSKYQKPLKDHMSRFMRLNRNPSDENLSKMESIFKRTCEKIAKNLGEKPFHLKRGLNAATFDCVMVAFANNLDKHPKDIIERYNKLVTHLNDNNLNTSSTTDLETVSKRFSKAVEMLFQ